MLFLVYGVFFCGMFCSVSFFYVWEYKGMLLLYKDVVLF